MAKVRLEGAIRLEVEVKYGLDHDIVIRVHEIPLGDGKRVLIGEGDISNIPDKTLSYIGDRIEKILSKDKSLIALDGFGKFVEYYNPLKELSDAAMYNKAMYNTELGTLIMRAYKWRKPEALEEVLDKKLFPLSEDGMREFKAWVKARAKAKELGCPMSTAKKVEHLI
jgi:hypothetical protein